MVVDVHAHACGELGTAAGILAYLQHNVLDKIVLCPGEQNSSKNYPVPMMSNVVPTANIGYGFNQVIRRVVKRSGAAETIHAQNETIANLAQAYPDTILQAYWLNPLEEACIQQMASFYKFHSFCRV